MPTRPWRPRYESASARFDHRYREKARAPPSAGVDRRNVRERGERRHSMGLHAEIASSLLTNDRDRLRHRLLAFAGLAVLLTGLLAAASLVVVAVAVFGVLLAVLLAAVVISLLRRLRLGHRSRTALASAARGLRAVLASAARGLRAVLASTALAFRGLRTRLHHLGVRRRAQHLGTHAREAASRAPGRADDVLARVMRRYAITVYRLTRSYAHAVHWLRMRTARALRPDGRLTTSFSRLKPRPGGRSREALLLNEIGARLRREGAHEEAAEQHRVALTIVRDLGDEQAEALTLNSLALALAQGGAEEEAVQHLEQARAVLRGLGDEAHEGQVIANLGIVHRRQGHSEEAVQLLHEALDKLPPQSPAYRRVEEELRRAS
jgi:tetratricopeptide (TPR) repeat protein